MSVIGVKKLTVCIMLGCCSAYLGAETSPMSEFEKWQKQRAAQFNQYVSKQDQDFNQFLKQRWLVKDVEHTPKRDLEPKIKQPPIADPNQELEPDTSSQVKVIKPVLEEKPEKENSKYSDKPTVVGKPVLPKLGIAKVNVEFLGNSLSFAKIPLPNLKLERIDDAAIAASWQTMAKSKNAKLIEQLNGLPQKLNLDDWGRAYLTYEIIRQGNQQLTNNEVNLYTWYYLLQQGFDARVGFESGLVHLLLHVSQTLYGQKFFSFGNDKYYFVNFSNTEVNLGNKIKTYQSQHALANSDLTIDLSKMPLLAGEQSTRTLTFKYLGRQHEISVPYNKSYVEFLNLYPQMELEHYFQTGLQANSKQALLSYLADAIDGKTEKQALNFLLRFVQKAFPYQTDDQQFNKENFLVATETLHYPYADCEDRSVLFSYLVKNLLGNKIIGVLYKGHIATAIKTNSDIDGAWYKVNGEKYLVADPTYIGARLGQVMPGYEKQSPKLVVIN